MQESLGSHKSGFMSMRGAGVVELQVTIALLTWRRLLGWQQTVEIHVWKGIRNNRSKSRIRDVPFPPVRCSGGE
jgi:hypothetical protein